MTADGSGRRQVTDDAVFEYNPVATPDGRYLVFLSTRSGKDCLWRTDVDSSHAVQLTDDFLGLVFDLSPDGRWIVFQLPNSSGKAALYKVSIDGGGLVLVADRPCVRVAITIWGFDLSRDGKQLVIARGGQSADVLLISEVK
ncbi:MAG: PD40 domain-containing protein [Acidobacteria bacterium]|nr:PD40 domain-containing protein [Acidobacteriota bacterium]